MGVRARHPEGGACVVGVGMEMEGRVVGLVFFLAIQQLRWLSVAFGNHPQLDLRGLLSRKRGENGKQSVY